MRGDDLNNVEIKGQLVRDPELKYTGNGTAVMTLSIAYKLIRREKEKVFYFDVVQFGPSAEDSAERLHKGMVVEIYGRLEQDRWTDREGNSRSRVQIAAKDIEPVDSGRVAEYAEEEG